MPRDAEAWLAERGIERDPIRLTPRPDEVAAAEAAAAEAAASTTAGGTTADASGGGPASHADADAGVTPARPAPSSRDVAVDPTVASGADDGAHGPPPSVREAALLAGAEAQAQADAQAHHDAARAVGGASLSDDVAEALAFVRRSTATAPQSVGRLRDKLVERGTPSPAIELAMERAHAEGLVDDRAMAAALVEEGRRKGHAPTRLRADLTRRGFDRALIDEALQVTDGEDLSAAAFALARERADRLTAVEPETAVRRIVGQLARRGYPEALARKVARDAVYTTRDDARTAGR